MGSHSKNSPLNRQSRAEHLDKLLDEALEQTFPASDPVAIDFERSGDSSGRDSAVKPDQSGRMRQQSVETPGAAGQRFISSAPARNRNGAGAIAMRNRKLSRRNMPKASTALAAGSWRWNARAWHDAIWLRRESGYCPRAS
jgi:hypothetical protein